VRGGWTVKQLERQMNSQFYERTALSKTRPRCWSKGRRRLPEDKVSADEEIRNPLFLLEFLGLKDEYSESELEDALIRHLEIVPAGTRQRIRVCRSAEASADRARMVSRGPAILPSAAALPGHH
jgi:hypothetical protein